jgi:hypothetical protein
MNQPSVVAVCLVNGRESMVKRAAQSFRAQTYGNAKMLMLDTGAECVAGQYASTGRPSLRVVDYIWEPAESGLSIGMLRNLANRHSKADILIHFDSDDYSHPNRIAEQVALLQSSGNDCVGYRDMLFYDETPGQFCGAWMYTNGNHKFCLGTSLCYWRRVWERHPFPDLPKGPQSAGEDTVWLDGVRRYGDTSLVVTPITRGTLMRPTVPRMIASIHGGNTTGFWLQHRDKEPMFSRAPEWDEYCRTKMILA